ncbi:MAG: carbohydrate ABC transporter permease [Nitrososphaeria archaeon]
MSWLKRSTSLLIKKIAIYISAIIVFVWTALPLYWMLATAFRPEREIYEGLVIPKQLSLNSILAIFGFGEEYITVGSTITPYMINSTYISIIVMVVSTILGVLGGYALARMRFPGKDILSSLSLFAYVFPTVVIMVPIFYLFSMWKLVNSPTGLILALLSHTLPYTLWMLRGFFQTIPVDIEEAAFIDGCNRIKTIIRIVFPLSTPGIVATATYAFILSWNNVLFPLILISRTDLQVVSIGILNYMKADFVPWDRLMAASFVATLPPTLLFFAIQRYIVAGLTAGAVKR